jgi:acyl-CoA synthetase (AMP-forming)/AMP-acid ligase II
MVFSFADILFRRAQHEPGKTAYRFFQGAALSSETLSFHALWEQAAALASLMQSQGLENQRALLVCKSQKNFVVAFYACLLAGTIAVPTAPPRRKSLLGRLQLIAQDAKARAVIFDCDELKDAAFELHGGTLAKLDLRSCIRSEDRPGLAGQWKPRPPGGDDIALLQYTSGSTGDPKGVVVSHSNLAHNCAAMSEAMGFSEKSSLLTALPLFHDMGLVCGVLEPMYVGCIASFLSPGEFAQYPERWLQIISTFQITMSGGPNFMYDLAARSVNPEEIPDLDLSSWIVAFCGAEPIRADVVSRFTQRFKRYGFKAEAFYPGYGLAESTLFVTGNEVGTPPMVCNRDGIAIVGCGVPWHDTQLEIVDPDTLCPLPEGEIGEIWISGSSVARGYWARPELTTQTFQARLAYDNTRHFLRTGDLGFLRDGELFVSGRLKDLIIINGQKYAPQDIEDEAERSHSALRQSGGAAFGVYEGSVERVVVIFELKREWVRRELEWPGIISAIRTSISTAHGLAVNDVMLIKPGALPRTSSGKVRRTQCRMDYLSGSLARVPVVGNLPGNFTLEATACTTKMETARPHESVCG